MDNIKLYYKGDKIGSRYTEALGKKIIKLGLREGDKIKSFPFNHFEKKASYREEPTEYQCKNLWIREIEYEFLNDYNGLVKTTIHIYLSDFKFD